jgi:hypothetical protein
MDAETIVGLLLFIVSIALLERLVIGVIWDAGHRDDPEAASLEEKLLSGREMSEAKTVPLKSQGSLNLHRMG